MGKLIFCVVACGLEICHKPVSFRSNLPPSFTDSLLPACAWCGTESTCKQCHHGFYLSEELHLRLIPTNVCKRFKVVGKHKRSCRKIRSDFISGSVSQETTATFSRRRTNILSAFLHFQDGCIMLHHFNPLWGFGAVFTLQNMENMTTGTNVASRLGRFSGNLNGTSEQTCNKNS